MRRAFVLCVMLSSASAAADPVTVSGNSDPATLTALTRARQQMTVCWQRKPPATVTIKLAVGKDGNVTKATAKTKGGAAQCAAGILAVSTLAPSAKAWKGSVVITADSAGKAKDARAVNETLVAAGETLRRCQGKAATFQGKVALKVSFGADGTLTDATGTVTSGTGGDAVATCVATAARKLTYPALSGALNYELAIEFSGEPSGGTTTAVDDITGGQQPSKKGPLDGDAILAVVQPAHAALRKCGKKGSAHGKVVVRVAIGADGKVTKATIKSSELDDSAIEDCAIGVFKKLAFPTAAGETVIQYPLVY